LLLCIDEFVIVTFSGEFEGDGGSECAGLGDKFNDRKKLRKAS
jgi:hypothetical protein